MRLGQRRPVVGGTRLATRRAGRSYQWRLTPGLWTWCGDAKHGISLEQVASELHKKGPPLYDGIAEPSCAVMMRLAVFFGVLQCNGLRQWL